jgi:hypothetical protein
LITAKHVLDEWRAQQVAGAAKGLLLSELMVRVNPIDVTSRATDGTQLIAIMDLRSTKAAGEMSIED